MPAVAAAPPAPIVPQAKSPAEAPGRARFERFREKFQAHAPARAWVHFRAAARELFGDAAFLERQPERTYRPLSLQRGQLELLARHPEKLQRALRELQARGTIPEDGERWNAKRFAGLASLAARSVLPRTRGVAVTVATVNDDFTDRRTNLRRVKADVLLVQEAKNTNLRRTLSKSAFGVNQDTRSDDRAGSAVVWKRDAALATDGGLALGVRPNGAAMLTRWITWSDLDVGGRKVRMISVHRPPKRFARLWPAFDAHLARFVRNTRGPVVVGMDANQRDPQRLARLTGLEWRAPKGSIDGFLVSPGVTVEKMWRLPRGTSDHHPVVARIRFRPKGA